MSQANEQPVAGKKPFGLEGFQHPPEDRGLSLEELSSAFAEMLGGGDDPYPTAADTPDAVPSAEPLVASEESAAREACEVSPRSILEAMLFVGHPHNEPLTSKQVASLMRGVRPQEIDTLVVELNELYDAQGCPYRIASRGAGYQLVVCDSYAALRDKFFGRVREASLSQAAIDVLAIVAYRQPLTRDEVDVLRGKPSGAVLSQLLRRKLLRIERSEDGSRKPRYHTADRFLKLFGLESLAELPQSQDSERTP